MRVRGPNRARYERHPPDLDSGRRLLERSDPMNFASGLSLSLLTSRRAGRHTRCGGCTHGDYIAEAECDTALVAISAITVSQGWRQAPSHCRKRIEGAT